MHCNLVYVDNRDRFLPSHSSSKLFIEYEMHFKRPRLESLNYRLKFSVNEAVNNHTYDSEEAIFPLILRGTLFQKYISANSNTNIRQWNLICQIQTDFGIIIASLDLLTGPFSVPVICLLSPYLFSREKLIFQIQRL